MDNYPNIDMEKTGKQLRNRIEQAGYSVKDIQKFLRLSCPQPIYRWYKGKALPSIDHLYAISKLLNVHMEDLLVPKEVSLQTTTLERASVSEQRLWEYWKRLKLAA